MSQGLYKHQAKPVRNSKIIDDDDPIQMTPQWTDQQYLAMNSAFCRRMATAVENGRERPRENKLEAQDV